MDAETRQPHERKREKILAAAAGLFARFGLRKTTMDDIAREAGLGKGTIYLYFKSKEDVYSAVVNRDMEGLLATLRNVANDVGSAEARLRRFFICRLSHFHEHVREHGITLEVLRETVETPLLQSLKLAFQAQEASIIEDILKDGMASGELRSIDASMTGMAISAALEGVERPWICRGEEVALDKRVHVLLELFFGGLRKDRGQN